MYRRNLAKEFSKKLEKSFKDFWANWGFQPSFAQKLLEFFCKFFEFFWKLFGKISLNLCLNRNFFPWIFCNLSNLQCFWITLYPFEQYFPSGTQSALSFSFPLFLSHSFHHHFWSLAIKRRRALSTFSQSNINPLASPPKTYTRFKKLLRVPLFSSMCVPHTFQRQKVIAIYIYIIFSYIYMQYGFFYAYQKIYISDKNI